MGLLDWLWGVKDNSGFAGQLPEGQPASAADPFAASPEPASPPAPAYTLESAIELMRTLPFDDDPELVLRVVRKTLRSTGVSVEQLISSAEGRESTLVANVASDLAAIAQLEQEVAARKANIGRLEAELAEIRNVRARLEAAVEGETKLGPVLPPDEMARLQAEASKGPPPLPPPLGPSVPPHAPAKAGTSTPPMSQPAGFPRPPMPPLPPLPKSAAPAVPEKPLAPKLQAPMPPRAKPAAPGILDDSPVPSPPISVRADSLPVHSEPTDAGAEPTVERLAAVPDDAVLEKKE
jgi:hypothetical protein